MTDPTPTAPPSEPHRSHEQPVRPEAKTAATSGRTSASPPRSAPATAAAPVAGATRPTTPRVTGIDAARGLALLGMMAVHSLYIVDDAGDPTLSFTLAAGRAAALFAVLAGVGIAFTTGRARVAGPARAPAAAALAARAGALLLIGLALGYTDAELGVVILPYYAMLFLLAIPIVCLPTWAIATVGVVVAAGMPILLEILAPALPAPTLTNPSLPDVAADPAGWAVELLATGEFPALPWITYLCAGLVVGRLHLSTLRTATTLTALGAALAVGAAATSQLLLYRAGGFEKLMSDPSVTAERVEEVLAFGADGTTPGSTWWWLAVDAPHTSTPLDLAGTTGSALAAIGTLLMLGHAPVLGRVAAVLTAPLAAAGSMTLTLYVGHIWFINSPYDTYTAATGYLLQVIAALALGLAIRAAAGRGPLEALVTAVADRARAAATPTTPPPPST